MVSWDVIAKFSGRTPHVRELLELAEKCGFSNIESMEILRETLSEDQPSYRLIVNNRAIKQTEFKVNILQL